MDIQAMLEERARKILARALLLGPEKWTKNHPDVPGIREITSVVTLEEGTALEVHIGSGGEDFLIRALVGDREVDRTGFMDLCLWPEERKRVDRLWKQIWISHDMEREDLARHVKEAIERML